MRRLAEVGAARLDPVVRSDRDVHLALPISIQIAHEEDVAAVGIVEPALVGAGDARAEAAWRLARKNWRLLGGQCHGTRRDCEREES